MYCSKCGQQNADEARFCNSCGAPMSSSSRSTGFSAGDSSTPLLVLRPVFVPSVAIASIIPLQLFFTDWGGGFFGGFGMFGAQALGLDLPMWFTFVFFGALFFFAIPFIAYTAWKKTYAKTEYRFFPNKLDYYEGFFTVEEKSIAYRNITEVNLRKGIFQQKHGLGTIVLSTPATGAGSGRARSGIRVRDIENPDVVYRQVKDLISRAR